MHSLHNSSHRASGEVLPSPMSLRETHIVSALALVPFASSSFPSFQYDINGLSDKDKFKLLSAKALDYVRFASSRRFDVDFLSCRSISTVPYPFVSMEFSFQLNYDNCSITNVHSISTSSLRTPFHSKVTTRPSPFSLLRPSVRLAFKRCVTTFLSRERECDEHPNGQSNRSIVDHGVRATVAIFSSSGFPFALFFSSKPR